MNEAALGWWVISGEQLMEMLQRVSVGENLNLVYAEYYANCDHQYHGPKEGDDE